MEKTKYDNIFIDGEDVYVQKASGMHKLCKWVDNVGYYQVVWRENGKRKYVRVHRLIAETLLPNPNNLPQVDHKDGNKLNNALSNLEWVSNAENTQRGYNSGLYHSSKRSHKISAKHKTTGKVEIYKSIRSCADALGLNRKTITAILKQQKANNYDYEFQYV